jgi:hypothetical protein
MRPSRIIARRKKRYDAAMSELRDAMKPTNQMKLFALNGGKATAEVAGEKNDAPS